MSMLRGWAKQIRTLVRKESVEGDLEEEMAFHLEMETLKNLEAGMTPEEARRAARLSFGGIERFKEEVRDARWVRLLEDLGADLRYASRSLLRRPGFTAAAVVTLALGIGGTTTIFGVVDAIFMRYPSGVDRGSEVVQMLVVRDEGNVQTPDGGPGSYPDFVALQRAPAFREVAAYLGPRRLDLGRGAEAEQVRASLVSHGFFSLLGVEPSRGRLFLPEEDGAAGTHPVAVISHGFWRSRMGGDPDVLGRELMLNGEALTIVGVAEPAFAGLSADPVDVWTPLAMAAPLGATFQGETDWRSNRGMAGVSFLGRVAPGVAPEVAASEAEAVLRHDYDAAAELDPTPGVLAISLIPGRGPTRSQAASLSIWLALVAGMVLVIAAANVANLLLAKSTARGRELAVRSSLGAGRGRLLRQHLTESLVLATLGAGAALLVAYWGGALVRQFPVPPTASDINGRVLAFTLAVSVLTGLLFGILPAVRASRVDPSDGLKDSKATTSVGRGRLRRGLIVLQVAMSLVLLVGAGLFVRSLQRVYAIDPGVDVDETMVVSMDLARAGVPAAERPEVFREAAMRALSLSGVSGAAIVHFTPFAGMSMSTGFGVPGRDTAEAAPSAAINLAGPGYFETAGTAIVAGRGFGEQDRGSSEQVVVVNRALAREIAADGDVVGMCLPIGAQVREGGCTRILGVAEDTRQRFLDAVVQPTAFFSWEQDPDRIPWGGPAVLVRLAPGSGVEPEQVRAAVQGLRPDLPYVSVRPLTELVSSEVLPYRLGATLFSLFAALALVLAAVGVYGVLAYFVSERTPEIGIRRSLGAPRRAVLELVVRQGMAPVVLGVALGLAVAFAGSTLLSSLLFGVDARDPLIFGAVATFLVIVSLAATLLPARRATRVDPMVALRHG